ncbi:translation initiation factor IF-5A [Candidatus Woesearchaeota archaeon]|nr:translation initiation factor IF-5A [Candidatus Woesearchaeota archaeon]|tara:strand:+ start:2327 stop:2722 length:396 start_codon:yes stop_codon:yes gene_type:complete
MATKKASVGSLQKGSYIIIDGHACRVADTQTSRPGKHGHAKVRMSAVGLIDEKKRIIVMPGHDQVDVPIVEKKIAQVLSVQGDTASVMDTQSYETFDLKVPDDLKDSCVEGIKVLYWDILGEKVMKQTRAE